MDQHEMFQLILKEVKESYREVMEELKEVNEYDKEATGSINKVKDFDKIMGELKTVNGLVEGLEDRVDSLEIKIKRIEKAMNTHTNSFKFDVDYLAEKQTKTDMKVNRLEQIIKS